MIFLLIYFISTIISIVFVCTAHYSRAERRANIFLCFMPFLNTIIALFAIPLWFCMFIYYGIACPLDYLVGGNEE